MSDPYSVLGVAKDAATDVIKRAFRKKAAKAHPDKPGGSDQAMAVINQAWDLLSDPERRRRYDESGDTTAPRNPRQQAEQGVIVLIGTLLDEAQHEEGGDLIELVRDRVRGNTVGQRKLIQQNRERIARLERIGKRIAGPMVPALLDLRLNACKGAIAAAERQIETDRLVLELLDEYRDLEPKPAAGRHPGFGQPGMGQSPEDIARKVMERQSGFNRKPDTPDWR